MKISGIASNINSYNFCSDTVNNRSDKNIVAEERYNKIGALSGLSALALLGVALIYNIKPHKSACSKKPLKKYTKPTSRIINYANVPFYRGPNINIDNKQDKSIHSAWKKYIYSVEKRIDSHDNSYEEVFIQNQKKLDQLEKVAEKRRINPEINPAA